MRDKGRNGKQMRLSLLIIAGATLAACAARVPESGTGYGDPYAGGPGVFNGGTALPQASTGFSTDIAAAAIDRASGITPAAPAAGAPLQPISALPTAPATMPTTMPATGGFDPNAPLAANRPRGNEPTTIAGTTSEMNGIASGGISDEQDFEAVSARETIESDKERIARNRAQYTVIQPTAVPERTNTGPNLAEYALSTTHNPGTQMYSRSAIRLTNPLMACSRYTSSDLAQQAFLAAGGPERDRKGLDPDGDGFACSWDPRPFRLQ